MSTIQLQTLVVALAATVSFGQNTLCGRPFDFSLPAGTDRTNAVSVALLSELAYHYSAWTNDSVVFETETQGHLRENGMALDFIDSFERIFPRGFTVETNGTMTIAVDGNFYTRFESAFSEFGSATNMLASIRQFVDFANNPDLDSTSLADFQSRFYFPAVSSNDWPQLKVRLVDEMSSLRFLYPSLLSFRRLPAGSFGSATPPVLVDIPCDYVNGDARMLSVLPAVWLDGSWRFVPLDASELPGGGTIPE